MKVVVTGFQPFGKETMNPSFEAVRLLPDEIKGAQIVKKEIPVVFRKGGQTVQEIVRAEKPDIVILVGQAGGRTSMNVERVAIMKPPRAFGNSCLSCNFQHCWNLCLQRPDVSSAVSAQT